MDRISCPSCGESYQIDATYQGRSFACHCGAVVAVPAGPAAGVGAAPPPPPPPPPHGYGYQGPASQSSTTALVFGLLGVLLCGIFAPFAWSIGGKARREAQAKGMEPDGTATAGYILGIIGTILLIFSIIGILIWVVLVAGVASSGMSSTHM